LKTKPGFCQEKLPPNKTAIENEFDNIIFFYILGKRMKSTFLSLLDFKLYFRISFDF